VVGGEQRLAGVHLAVAIERPEQLLLLGVDAHDRVVRAQVFPLDARDVDELGVAIGVLVEIQVFEHLTASVAVVAEELADGVLADVEVVLPQVRLDLAGGQVGPDDLGTHGRAGGVVLQDGVEGGHQFGHLLDQGPVATPLLRTRWLGAMSSRGRAWSCSRSL
jgi:hypothetical protein